jgi:type II secretory pathway pseudopilin PulG
MDDTNQSTPETKTPTPAPSNGRSWFLIRLLAYGAVILIVLLMLLPAQRSAREAARRNSCMNNLKQISLALIHYESANGAYPPAYTVDAEGRPLHSWRTLILPYMEQQALYDSIDLTKPWDDPANEHAYNAMPEVYRCPSDPTDNADKHLTTYLAVVTPDSAIRTADSLSFAEIPAPSETLLVIDAAPSQATHWMSPVDADEEVLLNVDPDLKRQHSGDIWLAAYADGHASVLSGMIDPKALRAMITATADDNDALQEND